MELHDTDNATKFDTEVKCQEWIAGRIVRFKYKVQHGVDKDGKFAVGPLMKAEGRIVVTSEDGFKTTSLDEPLANYAYPRRHEDESWFAVMEMR